MEKRIDTRYKLMILALFMIFSVIFFGTPEKVHAVEPGAYTATMTPHYAHPETGVIEDSGGPESMEIGQGMTEGATSRNALIEVDKSGNMFATVRFTLLTNTSTPQFQINGSPVTAECTKASGDIGDFRMPIPNENCVIRCNMHVIPMDRDVIFYMTLSGLTPGTGDFVSKVETGTKSETKENEAEEEKEDKLADNRAEAKSKIDALENLSKEQKKKFITQIENAESVNAIDIIISNAEKQDGDEAAKKDIGKVKAEALKKIDKMKNLSDKSKQDFKDRVSKAKNIKEVKKILKEAENTKSSDLPVAPIVGGAVVIIILIIAIIMVRKKRKNE